MQLENRLDLLQRIASHKHRTSYGGLVSPELMTLFQLKNLFLFSFKLLQRYETLTISTCSQINKNILVKDLKRQEAAIERIKDEIEKWKLKIEKLKAQIEILRKNLKQTGHYFFPSGLDKLYPLCLETLSLESDMFINCDDILMKVEEESYKDETISVIPQRPLLSFYRDIMFIQLHFHLLIVQGCNYAMPLLYTRFSFLNRIIHWPKPPVYGFAERTHNLINKLVIVKAALLDVLCELIKAICEIEKWDLFYRNNHLFCHKLMQSICQKKVNLLQQLYSIKSKFLTVKLEHSRLVGAIIKVSPNFFKSNRELFQVSSMNPTESRISSNSTSSDLFSIKFKKSSSSDSTDTTDSSSEILTILSKSQDYKKTDTTNVAKKPPRKATILSPDQTKKEYSRVDSSKVSIPSKGRSRRRLVAVNSLPDENLFCQCVKPVPPVNQTRNLLVKQDSSKQRLEAVCSLPDEKLFCHCDKKIQPVEEIKEFIFSKPDQVKSNDQNNISNNIFWKTVKKISRNTTPTSYQMLFKRIKHLPEFVDINQKYEWNQNILEKLSNDYYYNQNSSNNNDDRIDKARKDSQIIQNVFSEFFINNRINPYKINKKLDSHKSTTYQTVLSNYLKTNGFTIRNNEDINFNEQNDQEDSIDNHSIFQLIANESKQLTKVYNHLNPQDNNFEDYNDPINKTDHQLKESIDIYMKYL